MAIAPAFDLVDPVNDDYIFPSEDMQIQEAAMASLLTCRMPSLLEKEIGACSVSLCEICNLKKEPDQVIKNGNCCHSFCLECVSTYLEAKIKEGMKNVACPGLNCVCNIELDSFRDFLSNDDLHLWEKALHGKQIPNFTCRKELSMKKRSEKSNGSDNPLPKLKTEQLRQRKFKEVAAKKKNRSYNSKSRLSLNRGNETHKSAHSCSKNKQPMKRKVKVAAAGTDATPAGETSCKWKGLEDDEKKDHQMVWPPMVVITNTILKKDENNKWTGMTTQGLLDLFSPYDAIVRVQHSYNWQQGHCGTSILIFESSARGYLEAERLHKHFAEEGKDRYAWNHRPLYFLPTGERQLYGYMAMKGDVDYYNKFYSKGSPKLRYEMRSYQELVVNRIRQMGEDNYQLLLKNRVAEQQGHANDLEESNIMLKEKLHKAVKEMDIMRRRVNQHHEQSVEELEFQEQFYKDQIKNMKEAIDNKDGNAFEKIKQEQEKMKPSSNENSSNTSEYKHREKQASPEGRSSLYFDKSWGELVIPIIGAAIPIIWKIIKS